MSIDIHDQPPTSLPPTTCSAWQVWHVKICYNGEDEMRPVAQTFKARNKREAERKFSRFLAGRGIYAFRVFLQNAKDHTRP